MPRGIQRCPSRLLCGGSRAQLEMPMVIWRQISILESLKEAVRKVSWEFSLGKNGTTSHKLIVQRRVTALCTPTNTSSQNTPCRLLFRDSPGGPIAASSLQRPCCLSLWRTKICCVPVLASHAKRLGPMPSAVTLAGLTGVCGAIKNSFA